MDSKLSSSNHHNILITNIFDMASPISQFYKQIHKTIDEMDIKVQEVIKKHQGQFLLAYRNHIKKIKKQLSEIKQKSEDQQKMFSSNDRIQYLQKQMSIFRQQALKLYDKLEVKTQQLEIYKAKIKQIERQFMIKDKELKQSMKISKFNEATKSIYQNRIKQLEEGILIKDQQIKKLKSLQSPSKNTSQRVTLTDGFQLKLIKNKSHKHNRNSSSKPNNNQPISIFDGYVHDSQLKQWFISCIRTVKKQVAQRKAYSRNQIDLGYIRNIDEFRMVDKLRLLEMFLQNQKLLVWMYEKIFPGRIQQIKAYLSQPQKQKEDNKGSVDFQQQEVSNKNEDKKSQQRRNQPMLPEVTKPQKKSESKTKHNTKNFKLNLSIF